MDKRTVDLQGRSQLQNERALQPGSEEGGGGGGAEPSAGFRIKP